MLRTKTYVQEVESVVPSMQPLGNLLHVNVIRSAIAQLVRQ